MQSDKPRPLHLRSMTPCICIHPRTRAWQHGPRPNPGFETVVGSLSLLWCHVGSPHTHIAQAKTMHDENKAVMGGADKGFTSETVVPSNAHRLGQRLPASALTEDGTPPTRAP